MYFPESELILNADGSVFHLHLKPEQIADKIILVGDPGRCEMVKSFFSSVECEVQNREFKTITGKYNGHRISVVATGIGCDNIDIVLNELDALVNIDLQNRCEKPNLTKLQLVRIGTSGGLQTICPEGSFVASARSIGFDGVLPFYRHHESVCDTEFKNEFAKYTNFNSNLYVVKNSERLLNKIAFDFVSGNTISSCGFYGPQGRRLRLELNDEKLNEKIQNFRYGNDCITNYEMEGSAIAGLSAMLGHEALTVCLIIANRVGKRFIGDYSNKMQQLIKTVLDRLCN